MLKITFLLICFLSCCNCRNALKYFLEHRKVQNSTFIVLTNTSSDVVWIEYSFYFQNPVNNTSEEVKNFNVGLFENFEFDCNFSNGLTGYTFEIFKLLESLDFRFNYKKFNHTRINNITTPLITNEVEILGCHPTTNANLYSGVIQLYPTLSNNYVLIYDPYKIHFTKDIFILTFAGTLWICFFILLAILAVCLHLSTKQYFFLDLKFKSWNWVDITLWANAAACQQGLSHTPDGFASRLIFFLGYVISYLLYTGFAAGITSLLLQQVMNKEMTVTDIEKMNVKIVMLKNFEYLTNLKNNTVIVPSVDSVFANINQDDVVGVLPKLLVEQHYAKKPHYSLKYATSKLSSSQYSKSFLVLRNSSYRLLNSKLMRLRETGLLAKVLKDSLMPIVPDENVSKHSSAGIEHVGSAIIILVVGTVGSTIFLVFELIFALYNGKL